MRTLRRQDLREQGWKALVTALGIANATRFVMELHESEHDYSTLRHTLFAETTLDDLYTELQHIPSPQ